MFKSSFALECLEETRGLASSSDSLDRAVLPRDRHRLYRSQFAASTHGPLDALSLASAEDPAGRPDPFPTSDLGASDFSSSELWPSASPSPFDYSQRYRRGSYGGSSPGTARSFLNLQSSMQFSQLKKACEELELGLCEEDWAALATNLLKQNVRNAGLSRDSPVQLGDFLAELQSVREERRRQQGGRGELGEQGEQEEREEREEQQGNKALAARLAAKELETLQVRLECQHIYTENLRLRDEYKQLKQLSSPQKFVELQKEVEQLHWQLNKMENSRKLYELATGQLVTFLEQVSSSLSSSASLRGSQLTLADTGLSAESLLQAKRLGLASLDMARSKSMPGLADSLLALQTPARRLSAREKRVRRSSSVSKTRVSSTSPLPSLAEQEDGGPEDPPTARLPSCLYQRSHSVSDPLCVSTPKAYKQRLAGRRSEGEGEEERQASKRGGTLTSLSSSSSASPPSTDTSRSGREELSSDSIPSLGRLHRARGSLSSAVLPPSRSLSSLLSDSKDSVLGPADLAGPEAKVLMASKASRLLKSVRLLLARERSYDVAGAEVGKADSSKEGRRGRRPGRGGALHCRSGPPPLGPRPLLKGPAPPPPARRHREELETEVDSVIGQQEVDGPEEQEQELQRKEAEEEDERQRVLDLARTPEIRSFPIHTRCPGPPVLVGPAGPGVPEARDSLRSRLAASKVVKRSRSFNRIFSYSMLGRSKEYRL